MPQDIKSIFIKVNTKEEFEELLQSGSVRDTQIAFILDTKQIWTHNTYFSCPYSAEEINENEYVIAQALNDLKSDLTDIADNKTDKISSSTDNAVVRFDGTSGNIQNSGVTINDSNHLTATKLITSGGTSSQFVKGDGTLDSNTYAGAQTSGGAANKAVSIPFGQVDSTSTSTAFTATVDGITELRDGVCVYLKNGVVTSAANCTLNVNGLGAKPMYNTMAATTAISTQWNVNYTMLFIYNSTRVSGGCWDMYYGYNSDSNTRGYEILEYYSGSKKVKTACQRYQILLTCMDGYLLPVYSGTYTTGTSKTLTTEKFNPNGQVYYYAATGVLEAGATPYAGTLFTQAAYNVADLRYSFNTGTTLTAGNDVYLVCVPQDDGSAVLHTSPIAFSLPSTEDGLIYKRLGKACSTYSIILEQDKPCYYYKNGSINLWTGTGTQTDVSKSTESNVIDVAEYDLMKINEVKGKSLVMNQRVKNPNPSTTNNTEWSAYNNSNVSKEYVDDGVKATILNEGYGYSRGIVVNCTGITNTHKYLAIITIKPSVTHDFSFETGNGQATNTSCTANQWTKVIGIVTASRDGTQLVVKPTTSNLSVNDTFTVRFASCIDLTQMFGAGNEPTTVEEVEAILGNDYYEYNTGEVVGNNVEKLDVTGFNMLRLTGRTEYATAKYPTSKWDFLSEDVVIKGMAANAYVSSGTVESYSISKESITVKTSTSGNASSYGLGFPVRVTPNTSYYFTNTVPIGVTTSITWFDNDGYFISYNFSIKGQTFTSPANAHWCVIIFRPNAVDTEATFTNPVFNLSNTSKNGTYEPYKHSEFPLNLTELTGKVNGEGTSVTIFPDGLHGVGDVFDSLIVDEDGYARRAIKRMRSVDLGSCTITSGSASGTTSLVHVSIDGLDVASSGLATLNALCSSSKFTIGTQTWWTQNKYQISRNNNIGKSLLITYDNTEYDFRTFKSSLSGVYLDFELSTPIEYVLDTPVQCVAKVYPNGTVKQVPVMPDSTPMVMDVTYLRDTGGFIGGMMNKLASLEARIAALEGE